MTNEIELLRQSAGKIAQKAATTRDLGLQADLYDMAARWHWLAGETTKLNERANKLEAA
jgi:hypothetical protein